MPSRMQINAASAAEVSALPLRVLQACPLWRDFGLCFVAQASACGLSAAHPCVPLACRYVPTSFLT